LNLALLLFYGGFWGKNDPKVPFIKAFSDHYIYYPFLSDSNKILGIISTLSVHFGFYQLSQ